MNLSEIRKAHEEDVDAVICMEHYGEQFNAILEREAAIISLLERARPCVEYMAKHYPVLVFGWDDSGNSITAEKVLEDLK